MAKIIQGGLYGEGKEVLTYPRYDRIILANGTLRHTLFDKKVGDVRGAATLTRADTNMEEGGQIPNVMKWEIHEIWLQYQAIALRNDAAMAGILLMLQQTVIDLDIIAKFKTLEVALTIFEGAKQIVHVPTVAGNNIPAGSFATFTGKLSLDIPIVLESQTTFKLNLEHLTAPIAGLDGDFLGFVWWIKQFIGPPVGRNR